MRTSLLTSITLLIALVACSDGSSSSDSGGTTGGSAGAPNPGTTTQQKSDCKAACDKMKFFDCSSAAEQAACYQDCEAATASQVEVFVACAQNSICDSECRTSIQPAAGPSSPPATAASCSSACSKLVQCNLIPVGADSQCVTVCEQEAYQYEIDCVINNDCANIESRCGSTEEDVVVNTGGTGGAEGEGGSGGGIQPPDPSLDMCQYGCDDAVFFECIDPAEQSSCRTKCEETNTSARETFSSCMTASQFDCDTVLSCIQVLQSS